MAEKYKARKGQDIWDITLQKFGTVENVFTLLADSGRSIDDTIQAGDEFTVNSENTGNLKVKRVYSSRSVFVSNIGSTFNFVGVYFTINGNTTARTNTKTGAVMKWVIGGVTYVQNNTPVHTFSVDNTGYLSSVDGMTGLTVLDMTSCNLVSIDLTDATNLTQYRLSSNASLNSITNPVSATTIGTYWVDNTGLIGTLNLSTLTGLGGNIRIYLIPLLTNIIFPASSVAISVLRVYSTGFSGVMNISNLTGLGGEVELYSNPNLNAILNPISSNVITKYNVDNTGLTGTLDVSTLTALSGAFSALQCANLTNIAFPSTSGVFTSISFRNCNITGVIDLSPLVGMSTSLIIRFNANMTGVTFPTNIKTFTTIDIKNCNLGYIDLTPMSARSDRNSYTLELQNNAMTAAEVNQILVNEDNDAIGGFTSRVINIAGTNAAADGSSGGFDGLTAKANLITKGFTVTTT